MGDLKVGLTTVYEGITIEYLEDRNRWRFELCGRERSTESLAKAKEAIDKPEPVKKAAKVFQRFEVLHTGGGYSGYDKRNRQVVTVTSVTEDRFRDDANTPSSAWVTKTNGERSKEGVHTLFLLNDTNKKLWDEYDALQASIKRLEDEAKKVVAKLEHPNLADYLTDEENASTARR